MLFLKDTASPQDYDQAIFRLQNQYIKEYVGDDGKTICFNMKPQTLLVDFDPDRVFVMQGQKAQVYNVNTDETGNGSLRERIEEELRISPIIVMNKDRIAQIEATDIMKAVSEYSKTRGVAEETIEIPIDMSLLDIDAIRIAIERENELGSKSGLTSKEQSAMVMIWILPKMTSRLIPQEQPAQPQEQIYRQTHLPIQHRKKKKAKMRLSSSGRTMQEFCFLHFLRRTELFR